MKTVVLTFVMFSLVFSGCDLFENEEINTENQLTQMTSTGASTFSCKINGEVWKASKEGILGNTLYKGASFYRHNDSLVIYARRESLSNQKLDDESYFDFRVSAVFKTGEYPLNSTASSVQYCYEHDDTQTCMGTNENFTGMIRITTMDTAKRIVAGTFECTLQKPDGTTLNVTDGRFDLVLSILN